MKNARTLKGTMFKVKVNSPLMKKLFLQKLKGTFTGMKRMKKLLIMMKMEKNLKQKITCGIGERIFINVTLRTQYNIKKGMLIIKIGVDFDNILNNLNFEWIASYNIHNNDDLTIEDIHSWDISKYVKNGKDVFKYLNDDLFKSLSPLPHSVEATKELSKKYELFIVTASYPKSIEVKMDWLNKHFPHISYDNVIICQRKDLVNVDLLIDDAPHNILNFPRETIVMDYAWNRDINKGIRVQNWLDIYEILK